MAATRRRRCFDEPTATRLPSRNVGDGLEEAAISTPLNAASLAYADSYVAEDEVLAAARARGAEVGAPPIGPGGGATLRFLATLLQAKSVVEVGTGCGVSGVWLIRGMVPSGTLTSVDVEAEHQRLARETFADAGIPPQRTRLITGRALDVLPRLTDGGYDLVFCDGDKKEYPEYFAEALRLLRPGGVVAIDNTLWHDRVADPAQRDPSTVTIRELNKSLLEDERVIPLLLPVGDGLLCAVKKP